MLLCKLHHLTYFSETALRESRAVSIFLIWAISVALLGALPVWHVYAIALTVMQEVPNLLGLTSGELSPWLSARFDLQAYQRGALRMENFLTQPYGGIQRRRGTEYIHPAAVNDAAAVRLFPFCYAEDDALLLEFFPGGMRVYRDGVLLLGADGTPYVLSVPWVTSAELAALHFTQVNDTIYVCCPAHPPVVLYRYGNTNWRCVVSEYESYPRETHIIQNDFLHVDVEKDGEYATLRLDEGDSSFTPEMEGKEYLLADADIPTRILFENTVQAVTATAFPASLANATIKAGTDLQIYIKAAYTYYFYRCIRRYTPDCYNGSDDPEDYPAYFMPGVMRIGATNNQPYEVCGDWELYTTGTWDAHWELWRSYDTPEDEPDFYLWNWTRIRTFSQTKYVERQNWALSGSEERPCRLVLVCRSADATTLGAFMYMKILGGQREYKFLIDSVLDAKTARAKVLRRYMGKNTNFATKSWSFGAIGAKNGYPRFSAMFQNRLWLGGMPGLPTTLLASAMDDYRNFYTGSNDDDAMHLTLVSNDQSRICWMCATRQLLIGTADSEWALTSSNGNVLSATTASFQRQSSVGSLFMPAQTVENTVLFVQRGGRRLREIAYRLEADGFNASDISLLAEHLFSSGVKEWCVQRGADAYVWLLMNDGTVAVLTLNLEQQVTAWQRVSFPGRKVHHLTAVQSLHGKSDEMWFVMEYEKDTSLVLERLCADGFFVDSQRRLEVPESGLIDSLDALAAHEVLVYTDSTGWNTFRVEKDGTLRLPEHFAGRKLVLGLPYFSELHTMPLESINSFHSVRQLGRFRLRVLDSSLRFEYRSSHHRRWEYYTPETDHLEPPYTGSVRMPQMPDAGVGESFCLRCSGGDDFKLLAISIEVDFHGK